MHTREHSGHGSAPGAGGAERATRRAWWVFGGFVALALILLAIEHRAHLLGWLPWIILLACPLMHLFMHGGHGDHGGGSSGRGEDR